MVYDHFSTSHIISCTPTVDDVDGDGQYELVAGMDSRVAAYNLDDGSEVGWTGGLAGQVKTPAVSDVNADGLTDIVVGDGKAVYVMTTNEPYAGLPYFPWVRTRHDNLNTGLFDIAAPTAVEAYDKPGDQGGVIVVRWTRSMDDGLRSNRVANYMLFRAQTGGDFDGGGAVNPLIYRKKLREGGVGNSAGTFYNERSLDDGGEYYVNRGCGSVDSYEKIAVLPAGTTYYEDNTALNGLDYSYYMIATSTSGTGPVENNYRYSPKSRTVTAAAHDNIPPEPPTNFDLEIDWDVPSVHLMWTRSVDDPMYEPGEPGDSARAKAPVLAFGAPWGTASPPAPYAAGVFRPGIDAASAASSDAGAGGAFAAYAPRGRGGAFPLSEKEGDALKAKVAEGRRSAGNYYLKTRPALPPGKDSGFDAGANDVETYVISKSIQGQPAAEYIFYYPVTQGNDVEYLDTKVSYGNVYYYSICAMDSENLSEEVGPLTADLNEAPPDGGPVALMPPGVFPRGADAPDGDDTFAATGAVDSAWGSCRTKAAKVVTCKPNPVTGTATFTITLPTPTRVRLDVYDLSGRRVDTVLDERLDAGGESVVWQPRVANGVYIYKLETPSKQYAGKVVVAR